MGVNDGDFDCDFFILFSIVILFFVFVFPAEFQRLGVLLFFSLNTI